MRASRDCQAWERAVGGVTAAARDGSNLVPPIIAAVEARVRELHSYAVPEVIALDVAAGSRPYLDWLLGSVASA